MRPSFFRWEDKSFTIRIPLYWAYQQRAIVRRAILFILRRQFSLTSLCWEIRFKFR